MAPPRDTKHAEKNYLQRSGSVAWERAKPFAPPGHDMVEESARLLHEFSVALALLAPRPGQRVLDLGAGACWTTEWLRRLNVHAIAVDIATDMLRVGGGRTPVPPRVAGDLESLPFAGAVFDHALCLNAFHHIPDGASALRELARILKPGGRAVFAEPGRGHADAGTSRTAVDEFGVQEREVIVSDFAAACREAGFAGIEMAPVSYVIPWYRIDEARWRRWQRLAETRRPARALRKIGLAVVEAFGGGKDGPLFEDALGMDLVRLLKASMEHHPVVVATR